MRTPSPTIAALLSFIFPGLGQLYAGAPRKALIWAIPMLLVIVAVAWLMLGGSNRLIGFVSLDRNQTALLIFNVAFFLYHVAAMIDAYDTAKRDRSLAYSRGASRTGPMLLAALIAVAIVVHGLPEVYGIDAHNALSSIFVQGGRGDVIPVFTGNTPNPSYVAPSLVASLPSASPSGSPAQSASPTGTPTAGGGSTTAPSGSSGPTATRSPLPQLDLSSWPSWAQDGRLNILLVGGDSRSDNGLDANSLRTDSMIMLSEDLQTGQAALFSFPRNLCTATNGACGDGTRYPSWLQIQLPQEDTSTPAGQQAFPDGAFNTGQICPGMTSDGLLTSLWHIAAYCSDVFQGSAGESGTQCQQDFTCDRAWRALVGTLQIFTGQQIDGIIAVNLNGFVDLVSNLPQACPTQAQRVALPSTPNCYGGLWLYTDPLQDSAYYDSQQNLIPVNFQQGCFFVDPEYSLAYARSRHQDSDYQREKRQQYVIQQVRRQLDPMAMLPNIPSLLQDAAANLYTTFSDSDIQYLAQAASRVDPNVLYEEDFAPSTVSALGSMQAIQDNVTNIFSTPEPAPSPQQQSNPCPAK